MTQTQFHELLSKNSGDHPFHEWIITIGNGVEGWWGEGYIIHTVEPMFTAKWGFTSKLENHAMGCGIQISEDRYLSCMMMSHQPITEELQEKFEDNRFQMSVVVVQYLQYLQELDEEKSS